MEEIYETTFFKELEDKNKPTIIPYLKCWGPKITRQNHEELLEKLMVDYLLKKDLIGMHFENYKPKYSDKEQMDLFEKELHHRIGKRPVKMEFLHVQPGEDLRDQFDEIVNHPDFECFLF